MRGAWYASGHRLGWLDGGTVLRRVAAAYLAGRRVAEFVRQGEEWFVERGAAAIYPEAAALVRQHHAAGTPVVLLSGGMDFLVAPVARALGATRWAAVEPEVEAGVLTGRLREPLCIDEGKGHWASTVAHELGVRLDECTCYTDDARGPALLELVGEPAAVNPHPRLRRAAVRPALPRPPPPGAAGGGGAGPGPSPTPRCGQGAGGGRRSRRPRRNEEARNLRPPLAARLFGDGPQRRRAAGQSS